MKSKKNQNTKYFRKNKLKPMTKERKKRKKNMRESFTLRKK